MESEGKASGYAPDFVSMITPQAKEGYIDTKGRNISDEEFETIRSLVKTHSVTCFYGGTTVFDARRIVALILAFPEDEDENPAKLRKFNVPRGVLHDDGAKALMDRAYLLEEFVIDARKTKEDNMTLLISKIHAGPTLTVWDVRNAALNEVGAGLLGLRSSRIESLYVDAAKLPKNAVTLFITRLPENMRVLRFANATLESASVKELAKRLENVEILEIDAKGLAPSHVTSVLQAAGETLHRLIIPNASFDGDTEKAFRDCSVNLDDLDIRGASFDEENSSYLMYPALCAMKKRCAKIRCDFDMESFVEESEEEAEQNSMGGYSGGLRAKFSVMSNFMRQALSSHPMLRQYQIAVQAAEEGARRQGDDGDGEYDEAP